MRSLLYCGSVGDLLSQDGTCTGVPASDVDKEWNTFSIPVSQMFLCFSRFAEAMSDLWPSQSISNNRFSFSLVTREAQLLDVSSSVSCTINTSLYFVLRSQYSSKVFTHGAVHGHKSLSARTPCNCSVSSMYSFCIYLFYQVTSIKIIAFLCFGMYFCLCGAKWERFEGTETSALSSLSLKSMCPFFLI